MSMETSQTCLMWKVTPPPGNSQTEPHGLSVDVGMTASPAGAGMMGAVVYPVCQVVPVCQVWYRWVPVWVHAGWWDWTQPEPTMPRAVWARAEYREIAWVYSGYWPDPTHPDGDVGSDQYPECYGKFDISRISALRKPGVSGLGTSSQPGKSDALIMSLMYVRKVVKL